jgi:hypothetical protein
MLRISPVIRARFICYSGVSRCQSKGIMNRFAHWLAIGKLLISRLMSGGQKSDFDGFDDWKKQFTSGRHHFGCW